MICESWPPWCPALSWGSSWSQLDVKPLPYNPQSDTGWSLLLGPGHLLWSILLLLFCMRLPSPALGSPKSTAPCWLIRRSTPNECFPIHRARVGKAVPFILVGSSTVLHLKLKFGSKSWPVTSSEATRDGLPTSRPTTLGSTTRLVEARRSSWGPLSHPDLVPSGVNLPSLMFRSKPQSSRSGLERKSRE